jgi:hypothetical protein
MISQSEKTNPIQTQSKPILERMNVNFCAAGYCEIKPTFAVRKGRPNNPNDARLSGRSSWRAHSLHDKSKVRGYNPPRCVTTKEKTTIRGIK